MQYFTKIADGADTVPLLLALQRQPELFGRHNERKQAVGGPHSDMTDIWIRHNDRRPYEAAGDFSEFNDEHDSVWYPEADKLPEVMPLCFGVMSLVRGERLGGVLITKIPPGGGIAPHIDRGWHAEYYDKYMVHLKAEPGVAFGFPDAVMTPRTGEVWWFRNDITHWIRNDSADERIVMIISIRHSKGALWSL